ncbi:B3 domain-containing transcription factor VRN1-like [Mercurialis annua]|uniref:B3 domain-containing transcription factor VRN1-like n=1 Tax=Mercurialis annua TaxID=3986 RepID=UPI002160E40C|nr:B3 domain-containing transcription factor VRN1-like [Mercurialis annua]
MNSCPLRDDGKPMMFTSKTPQFFKIILGDGKLCIPRKFVRLYGNNLPNSVILKVPSGAKWKIELTKSAGEIWFQNGWQEFVKYYSIAYGSFLIFQYDQTNSEFNVTIFDTSTLEIDYPFDVTNRNKEESHLEKQFRDEAEILNHKTKGKSPLISSHPPNKKIKLERSARKEEGNRAETLAAEAKAAAASNFQSKNPFFMVAMYPSFLHWGDNYRPSIPANFVKQYFSKLQGSAILSIDGNLWPVEYKYYVSVRKTEAKLNKGWKEFAIRNHIEIGDVCVFELIDPTNTTLKVTIFRHIKEAIKSPSLGNKKKIKQEESCGDEKTAPRHLCSDFSKAVEAANKFTSVKPFFKASISAGASSVYVPSEFAMKYSKKSGENVWLQIGNRKWAVKLIINRASYGWLSAGFSLFGKENCLKEGDVCIFELMNAEMLLLKVSIFRNVEK